MDQLGQSNILQIKDQKINQFARQLILEDFGEKKQQVILNSHITFIGMGGINCSSVLYLTAVGIKKINVIDYDKVQISNLNRQILYSKNDIGKSKVYACKKFLKKSDSNLKIEINNKKINNKNCNQLIKNTDLVIDGSDNWQTMLEVNDFCVKNNIPLISSSVAGYEGNLILFKNLKNSHLCLRCVFPSEKELNLPRCETVGVLGTSAGIIGLLSANLAINFLISNKEIDNTSKMIYFSGKEINMKEIKLKSNVDCKLLK